MNESRQADDSQTLQAVDDLLGDRLRRTDGRPSTCLVVAGPPRSGKTRLALRTLLKGMGVFGDERAFMAVSGRVAADSVSREVVRARGSSGRTRPVGTLQALAFRMVCRAKAVSVGTGPGEGPVGNPLPRLLNGAEQDALLRQVMAEHVAHVEAGDSCQVCTLLERYFASEGGWSSVLVRGEDLPGDDGGHVDDRFIGQLRDMFARMTELGVADGDEDRVLDALSWQSVDRDERERLGLQWRLAFALRKEYGGRIVSAYPGEYRLDPSMLMVEGGRAVGQVDDIPSLLVLDDWQDVTLAGMGFLQALNRAGCRLVLVGNCDESVQSFRGSYPEYLSNRVTRDRVEDQGDAAPFLADDFGCLGGVQVTLAARPIVGRPIGGRRLAEGPASYADLAVARISLGIHSEEEGETGVPARPGKMPAWKGALPIAKYDEEGLPGDGSVTARLFHTPAEEEDDLVWQVKQEALTEKRDWNDMAVIAHDNATIRSIGRKLRLQGVPVRYSTITRPLKEEPAIQGLFSLIDLAEVLCDPDVLADMTVAERAALIRREVKVLLASPLIRAETAADGRSRTVRVQHLDDLCNTICSLVSIRAQEGPEPQAEQSDSAQTAHVCPTVGSPSAGVHPSDGQPADGQPADGQPADGQSPDRQPAADGGMGSDRITALASAWRTYAQAEREAKAARDAGRGISVDDSLLTADRGEGGDLPDIDSLYALLILDPPVSAGATDKGARHLVLADLDAVAGRGADADVKALRRVLRMVDRTAAGIRTLPTAEPQYVLWEAWQAAGVADDWQTEALRADAAGEEANDRLDAMMRLFQYAEGSSQFDGIRPFIAQVRSMQIEADSLAHIGPVEHAVTLTTPAGASAGAQVWPLVWIPALQEGVWPNLAPRDTMFGADDLADLILHNAIRRAGSGSLVHDPQLQSILYAEKKGLLVAMTRATEQVRVSAVWNDDLVPSDFLYGFLPEMYERRPDPGQVDFSPVGGQGGRQGRYAGLELGARGLTAAARSLLVRQALADDGTRDVLAVEDAARALSILSGQGISEADCANWPFVYADGTGPDFLKAAETGGEGDAPSTGQTTVQAPPPATGKDRGTGRPSDPAPAETRTGPGEAGTVALSPSAVDGIWLCPLEWVLDNEFAGPSPGGVATAFGSFIHKVAQEATIRQLDRPDPEGSGGDPEVRIGRTTDALMDIYRELLPQWQAQNDPSRIYDIHRRDSQAAGILHNLASYYVLSTSPGYAQYKSAPIEVGTLVGVDSERPFDASLGMDEMVDLWAATYPSNRLGSQELFSLMSALAGGFPPALTPEVRVRLTGRIDRLEYRSLSDGVHARLVDYKTGNVKPGTYAFNDLQLVCYQLGLAYMFPEPAGLAEGGGWLTDEQMAARPTTAAPVNQAGLFYVAEHEGPSCFYGVENAYQPALFAGRRPGTRLGLNPAFQPRYHAKTVGTFSDLPPLGEEPPDGVSAPTWNLVLKERGSQAVWALTMIARVFYAAGVKLSAARPDSLFEQGRCHDPDSDGLCPAYKRLLPNIMEDGR
ncbi:PD-(D/E)XK nuclease family protein [Bifidobacterium favimelis]|uniref:PD-(D/E)XK nuclease family protein n=1 Tax=Bifidobacterium favimelis TaxID=3122979 RepID=A0ABU8ZNZ7_9BIFI